MRLTVKLFGILMLLLGVLLLINPTIIIGWMEDNMESTSLYIIAIGVRLVMGILFIVAARESKYPSVFKFLGYLFIIAAIIFIFIGKQSFQDFISSLIPNVKPFARLGGLLGIAFGGFLIYAFSRNNELNRSKIK